LLASGWLPSRQELRGFRRRLDRSACLRGGSRCGGGGAARFLAGSFAGGAAPGNGLSAGFAETGNALSMSFCAASVLPAKSSTSVATTTRVLAVASSASRSSFGVA
jgi:hypothetical protein